MDGIQAVLAIVLIDLALSGDNALVIGMAARGLPERQRRSAIVVGGAVAVVLRIVAATAVTLLLRIPYLQLAGGALLVVIAYRLVRPGAANARSVRPAASLREAVVTIMLADAVMSTENILGVGGAAHGDVALLAFGLAVSIPIVLFASGIIAGLLDRFPHAIWVGALALLWTAADLILDDPTIRLGPFAPWANDAVLAALLLSLVVAARRTLGARRS